MKEGRPAKAGEVDCHCAVVLREAGTDANPVVGTAPKAVDHEQRLIFSPEVEELDRPVQVYCPMPQCVKVSATWPATS